MIQLLLFLFASPAVAATANIDGEWRLVSFTCEGGKKDAVVTINQRKVARKEVEERITIRGSDVTTETIHWANRKERVGCERKTRQLWDIKTDTYRVLSVESVGTKPYGGADCPKESETELSKLDKPFRLKGKRLELSVNGAAPGASAEKGVVCAGGRWVRTYETFKAGKP